MSPVSSLWLLCIAITSAINDPYTSRYFIGNFTINPGTGQSIIQPYALNICVQEGLLIGNYVFYECSADNQTLTKRTYSTSDSDCSGDVEAVTTYTQTDNPTPQLYDFNCEGPANYVGHDVYLGGCNSNIGAAYLAIDVCFNYGIWDNITNEDYPDIPRDQKYNLSQIMSCDGSTVSVTTYIDSNQECNADLPLTQYISDTSNGCSFFVNSRGWQVYADVFACVRNNISYIELPMNTTEQDTEYEDSGYKAQWFYTNLLLILSMLINQFCEL